MNQVFDLNRWLLLVAKHWNENKKRYLLGLAAIAGLLVIWYVFMILANQTNSLYEDLQMSTYFVGLYLIGCLFGSMLFADLSGGPKAIHYLSVPASNLEKLLCALLYGVVLFYITYTAVFYLVDVPMVKVANMVSFKYWQESHQTGKFVAQQITNVFIEPHGSPSFNVYYHLFLGFIAAQAAFILGSVYFASYSFIKTVIVLLLVTLFFVFFIIKVLNPIMPHGDFNSFTKFRLYEREHYWQVVALPEWINPILLFLLKYAFAPVFWVATYFRLKEKEI
jgi:hypothetical protein